jgi:hypothetical protein
MARSQYALPGGTDRSDPRGKADLIRQTAIKYGIDPEIALKVAKSEGLSSFRSGVRTKSGGEEPSFGAFQLYTGGGLGNKFKAETGLDPSDPKNEDATIDYALRTAAKTGWGPWNGAKNTGIGEWQGITGKGGSNMDKLKEAADQSGAVAADTTIKGTNTDTSTPDVAQSGPAAAAAGSTGDFLTKLKDPQGNASQGLGEAVSGLGGAVMGASKSPYTVAPVPQTVPIAPTPAPAQVVPAVDPRAAESQRQQLAMAIQRLNSGRLY